LIDGQTDGWTDRKVDYYRASAFSMHGPNNMELAPSAIENERITFQIEICFLIAGVLRYVSIHTDYSPMKSKQ